jgi:hypothetical protein
MLLCCFVVRHFQLLVTIVELNDTRNSHFRIFLPICLENIFVGGPATLKAGLDSTKLTRTARQRSINAASSKVPVFSTVI